MKIFFISLFLLSSNFCLLFSQNVTITPVQTYPNYSYTPEEINNVVALSKSLEAQTKLIGISSTGILTYDPIDKWPLGTWMRGYLSTQDSSVFFDDIMWYSGGECYDFSIGYWGSHPMIRHTGEQVRSMIHLYNRYYSGSNSGDYLNLIENGLNYLISAQTSTGSYINWNFRPSKYQPNIEGQIGPNQHHVYSTANALATMCEGYMFYNKHPNLNFSNMSGLYNAIENAANNLLSLTSECYSNSNFKGLVAWSLAKSYKITNNCDFLVKAVHVTQTLINLQTKDASICNGIWQTGGPDGLVNHDTKIWYHLLIIKGLVETLDITPLTMHNFRVDLSNTIKRAINHIILGRINLNVNDPNRGALRPEWVDPNCNTVSYDLAYNFSTSVVEPIALLAYYSNYHQDLFTQQERTSLKNLLDLISTNANSFAIPSSNNQGAVSAFLNSKAMSYYADYSNAINTSQKVFNEDTPKIRNYDVNKITQRVVVGDFDNNGKLDDIAAFYDYGNNETRIHVWKKIDGEMFEYSGGVGWWSASGYSTDDIKDVVVGDFDRDGYKDDIAVIHDYGNSQTRIHMFKSTGSSFQYTGAAGYWQSTGYDANLIEGRAVSGDFNNNGYEDDIAVFYDYGNNQTRIHTFLGNVNSFIYTGAAGWWSVVGYSTDDIKDVVVGDFDRDGYKDDIAAFYDYGNSQTRIHMFKSTGSSFQYTGAAGYWQSTGYDVNLIKGRVVSGDFNNNGFEDDIAAFYDYGNNQSKIHVFLGNINNFIYTGANGYWNNLGYNANTITGRVLSGDFNNENKRNAIATFYDVGDADARLHVWKYKPAYLIFPNRFDYQGPGGWWIDCLPYYDVQNLLRKHQPETDYIYSNLSQEKELENSIKIFPNPSTNNVTISYQLDQVNQVSITLLTSTGSVLKTIFKGVQDEGDHVIPFNVSGFKPGIYYCIIKTENTSMSEKLVIIR